MEKITTEDNSITYFNEKYEETYHSKTGAKEESLKKFVEPCKDVIEANDTIKVLDICFGIGYNTAALLDYMKENYPNKKIFITALENDMEIVSKIDDNNESGFNQYNLIKELIKNKKEYKPLFKLDKENVKIKLIIEDAREAIKKIKNKFNIIFLDPFSPKKCPELWTKEFFQDIEKIMEKDAILTTYSCARVVKDNLLAVNLKIEDGPCVGRKSPSTIARK